MNISKRDSSIDVIRIFAVFSVISVHFFLNNGFYGKTVTGLKMYAMVNIRTFFMVCVPLFLILTGYLMSHKTLSIKYYGGIKKTLAIYLMASVANIIYKHMFMNNYYTLKKAVIEILNFQAANYSWYIEMYIGLFLMIPFLNLMYNGLKSKREKQVLIITFLFLTTVPMFTNTFVLTDLEWWSNPASLNTYNKILPSWWLGIYPITYYFIGCYIREFGITFSKRKNFGLLIITAAAAGAYNCYRSKGAVFQSGPWADWHSPFTVVMAVLTFTLILHTGYLMRLRDTPKKIIKYLSELTLGAYLVSYIFDNKFYAQLNAKIPAVPDRLIYFFVLVPAVFLCSMLLSALLTLFYEFFCIVCDAVAGLFRTGGNNPSH